LRLGLIHRIKPRAPTVFHDLFDDLPIAEAQNILSSLDVDVRLITFCPFFAMGPAPFFKSSITIPPGIFLFFVCQL